MLKYWQAAAITVGKPTVAHGEIKKQMLANRN